MVRGVGGPRDAVVVPEGTARRLLIPSGTLGERADLLPNAAIVAVDRASPRVLEMSSTILDMGPLGGVPVLLTTLIDA